MKGEFHFGIILGAKLLGRSIPKYNLGMRVGALALYYLDFIAEEKRASGSTTMWLIETKGWEQPDVAYKDARATEWCKDASTLTGQKWQYLKVQYGDYVALTNKFTEIPAKRFEELLGKLGFVV
jgi:hypothetical protein